MSKALISSGTFEHERLLNFSEPTFQIFGETHGYDVVVDRGIPDRLTDTEYDYRQARWRKIELIQTALESNEVVLWMDSDIMITKYDKDILDDLPEECFQGFVMECLSNRFYPNTGVWLLRNCPETEAFMRRVEELGLQEHSLADQPSVWRALGWSIGGHKGRGARLTEYSPFLSRTGWLPFEWNPLGMAKDVPGRVKHFVDMTVDERCELMAQLQAQLEALEPEESAAAAEA